MADLTQKHIVTIIDLLRQEERRLITDTDLPSEIAVARQYRDVEKRKEDQLSFIRDIISILEEEINKTVYKFESISLENDYFDRRKKKEPEEKIGTLSSFNYGLSPKNYGS